MLRHRRNAVAPISSLPIEVIAIIFSISRLFDTRLAGGKQDHLAWLRVTHVCHQWREIALNSPLFWSHINFTNITLAGATEMLARAKKVPLHLEAYITIYNRDHARFNTFKKELQSRVNNICHLYMSADYVFLHGTLKRLASPAPTLEYLSLSTNARYLGSPSQTTIPDTLFGGTAPRLFSLKLNWCNISWKSPLLKGLRSLEILVPSSDVRPSLTDWLDALDRMPQLKNLVLESASPIAPTFPFDIKRTVTLPFLTDLKISSSAEDCALSLSHLVLPVLTELRIQAKSVLPGGSDVLTLLPHVARHSHGPQDTQPLQNAFIRGVRSIRCIEIFAYPGTKVPFHDVAFLETALSSAPRVALYVTCRFTPEITEIIQAAMIVLPLDNLLKLTALDQPVDEAFWYTHAPRWPLLECVELEPFAAHGFREMILQDNGGHENPLLPSLTNLILSGVTLSAPRTLRLRDALMKRVDQGVPLETLDLTWCYAPSCADDIVAVELLNEIVANVLAPKAPYSGPVISDDDSAAEDYSDDDDEEEWGDEEIDDEEDDEEDNGATNGD